MPYTMDLYADAGCRPHSPAGPIAASAVTMTNKFCNRTTWTHRLPTTTTTPAPTIQRAQLSAVILALSRAHQRALQLRQSTDMDVTIHTASKYALGCMNEWCWKWMRNGFRNHRGREVANRDLIERALVLEGKVLEMGTVEWVWEPRRVNGVAFAVVEVVLDEMEPGYGDEDGDEDEDQSDGMVWEEVDL